MNTGRRGPAEHTPANQHSRAMGWSARSLAVAAATLGIHSAYFHAAEQGSQTDAITEFLATHSSNAIASPGIGLLAAAVGTVMASRYNKLRTYTGAALTAGALAVGLSIGAQSIYETDIGYEYVGQHAEKVMRGDEFIPGVTRANYADPIDTGVATGIALVAAMALARRPAAAQG